ncbi:uncharacterized protein [Miscanthus floridulus]|uniref:uncharacterized protein n=1 Tax=Miscanthus floridulus TaxID=154761 RepID=UPI003458D01B
MAFPLSAPPSVLPFAPSPAPPAIPHRLLARPSLLSPDPPPPPIPQPLLQPPIPQRLLASRCPFLPSLSQPLGAPLAGARPSGEHAPPGETEAGTRHPRESEAGLLAGARGPSPSSGSGIVQVPAPSSNGGGPRAGERQIRLRCSGSSTGAADPTPTR